jgi:hypothetical protein
VVALVRFCMSHRVTDTSPRARRAGQHIGPTCIRCVDSFQMCMQAGSVSLVWPLGLRIVATGLVDGSTARVVVQSGLGHDGTAPLAGRCEEEVSSVELRCVRVIEIAVGEAWWNRLGEFLKHLQDSGGRAMCSNAADARGCLKAVEE